jgi:hypothetical protein
MGERYLKTEEETIRTHYPTATRDEILTLMPGRTWVQIGAHARKRGVHRTSETWGNSVREGRKLLPNSWDIGENIQLINFYPQHTRAEICAALPRRAWKAIRMHAHRLGIERTREAKAREIQLGRRINEQKRNI